jgi:uncharacterized Zn-finger protein
MVKTMVEIIQEKITAQKKYCETHQVPMFVHPRGLCWNCNRQVFEQITIEKAGSELVTGCPFCHRSFVD